MKSMVGVIDLMEKFCKDCDRLEMKEDSKSEIKFVCKAKEFGSCYDSYTGKNTLVYWR